MRQIETKLSQPVFAYKGFDIVKVNGQLVEEGRYYDATGLNTIPDVATVQTHGFSAWTNPVDALAYRPPNKSRYCLVAQSGSQLTFVPSKPGELDEEFLRTPDLSSLSKSSELKVVEEYTLEEYLGVIRTYLRDYPEEAAKEKELSYGNVAYEDAMREIVSTDDAHSIAWAGGQSSVAAVSGGGSVAVADSPHSVASGLRSGNYAVTGHHNSVAVATRAGSVAETFGSDSVAVSTEGSSRVTAKGIRSVAAATGDTAFIECKNNCSIAAMCAAEGFVSVAENSVAVMFTTFGGFGNLDSRSSPWFRLGRNSCAVIGVLTEDGESIDKFVIIKPGDVIECSSYKDNVKIEQDVYYRYVGEDVLVGGDTACEQPEYECVESFENLDRPAINVF
jgi:hypothetical protein